MTDMVKELLENNTLTQEIAEALDTKIMDMVTPLRADLKLLREEKNTLSKSYDEVLTSKNGLDEQLKGLDEQITRAKAEGKSEIVSQLEAEKASKSELQKSLDNLQKANTNLIVDSAVSSELDKFDVKKEDKEMIRFFLRSKATMTEDGVRYVDGNDSTELSSAFSSYFEANGARLNPKGDGNGSGASGGGGGGQAVLSRETFDKMSPAQQAEAARTKTIKD